MAVSTPRPVAELIHRLASIHASAHTPDEELLRLFAATGDAKAFELLLWRHERMVMGVCRRVLRDGHDAEDAFQATFLVLARKARSITARRTVTTWLYTVAYRVALNALKERTRRRARVVPLPDSMELATPKLPGQADVGGPLDEAVNSLPAKYRGPVVLCLLEGRSHAEAARVLRCAPGTVASRLARAKARLRAWLTRRGVKGPDGALAAALVAAGAQSASARAVVAVTLQAAKAALAGGAWQAAVSPQVLVLAQGVLRPMFQTRILQILAVALTAVVVWGAGQCLSALDAPAAEMPPAPPAPALDQPEPAAKKTQRSDALGDPLPQGAIARLGSLRFYHGTGVGRVVLSPDGKWVVGWGKSNRLWDARTGKESPLADDLRKATFIATEDRLLALKKTADRVVLWDVAAGKEAARMPPDACPGEKVELSADGKSLVSGSSRLGADGAGKLVFTDAAKGIVRQAIDLQAGQRVQQLSFSADGSALGVHYADNSVEVWNAQTHKVIFSVALAGKTLGQVGLSPDGGMLAAAVPGEKQIRLWDVRAKKELQPMAIEPGRSTYDVSFSPNGKLLAVTHEAGVGVWDLAARKEVWRLKGDTVMRSPIFSRDGKWLAAGDGNGVGLWDLTTGEPCHDLGHGSSVGAVAFSPDGRTIASAAHTDNVVRTWDALTGQIKGRWHGHQDGIETVAYGQDGRMVASGSKDGTVRLWDAATGKEVGCLDAHDGTVYALAFSPDGKTLASSGGKRQVVHLWDVATRREVRVFDNPGGLTLCLAFSPDGKTLATRSKDGLARLWDVAAGTERCQFRDLSATYPRLSFAPDNRTLAVNCGDGTVRLLDVTTKEARVLGEADSRPAVGGGGGLLPPANRCLAVAFAPDGRSLAATYFDASIRSIRIWEVVSGRERARFTGHAGFAMGLAYSPDGALLVTGGTDRTALVWDVSGLRTSDGKPADLTRADADRLWAELADADAGKAFRAMQALRANGTQAVRLLQERLRPVAGADPQKIKRLVADLDKDDFAARDSATKQLTQLGDLAEPALRAALNDKASLEMHRRVNDLLKRLDELPELLRGVRAVEVLEGLGTPEALQAVQTLAQGAAEARLTREANATLERRRR
jgi:RNA polymerase sigma factor (sigma-70 family)